MKSHVNSILHVSEGILKDVSRTYPKSKGWDLDLKRLTLLCMNRGLGVFTLDLPSLESLLLRGLEEGRLPELGYHRVSSKVKVPRLFRGLWLRIFTKELVLRSDVDTNALFFLRTLLCIGKKTEVPCSEARERQAIEEYIHVESSLPRPTLGWDLDSLDPAGHGPSVHLCDTLGPDLPLFPGKPGDRVRKQALLNRCQQVFDIVATEIGSFCAYSFTEQRISGGSRPGMKHGPGAVAERTGAFDKNDFQHWPHKLEANFPFELFGTMPNSQAVRPPPLEVPSRLICVPKTAKSPRIIAAEPTEHMFCQQTTRYWLEERVSATFLRRSIAFSDQTLSQAMVKSASITRSHATVDLKSASDRLSLWVVERAFRRSPSLLSHLHSHRTKWILLPRGSSQSHVVLKKFASQGTAVTFPIQTIVFYCIAVASLLQRGNVTKGLVERLGRQVRVFGDDIILPTTGYERCVELLHILGLKVNQDKSFVKGHFRESCGMDCYMGDDVTPVKPKNTLLGGPASWQGLLDTSNNLFCKGLWHASETLRNRLDREDPKGEIAIVGRDAGATGHVSFSSGRVLQEETFRLSRILCGSTVLGKYTSVYLFPGQKNRPRVRSRWNPVLQRLEVRATLTRSTGVTRERPCGYSSLLQFALREPHRIGIKPTPVNELLEKTRVRKDVGWVDLSTLY